MATKAELTQRALYEMSLATLTPEQWCKKIDDQENYDYTKTHNFKAQQLLYQAAHTPIVPLPPVHDKPPQGIDLRPVQRCLFLTDDTSRALETHDRLLIATADLNYRKYYTDSFLTEAKRQGRLRVWCDCHATFPDTAFGWMDALGLPHEYFYGECESAEAFRVAYNAGARHMVGNVGVLTSDPSKPPDPVNNQLGLVDKGIVTVTNETYFNKDWNYGVNWRNADGVGSNCMAVYASSTEGAFYKSLAMQYGAGKYNPATDCIYVAGFWDADWEFLIAH